MRSRVNVTLEYLWHYGYLKFYVFLFCYVAMCTVVDGAAVSAEVALHEGSLFLRLPGSTHSRPPVQIRLHHQGLLTFLLLLLFQ